MKRALLAAVLFVAAVSAGAAQRPAAPQAGSSSTTEIFACGFDQKLTNPIPRRPTTLILAGDGRLFAPCGGTHTQEDREAREISLLQGALRSQLPEER